MEPIAKHPEDLTRLFVERANARDAEGLAALYAEDAVMAYPPGATTVGRDAILEVMRGLVAHAPLPFAQEDPLPTLRVGDLALTATPAQDGPGARVQLVERQPDGRWLRVIDRPE
jgi:ketosteroid isomerase-like protein